MVYEYCDEIKNSGINRNAFPASCTSFMEMGLYITESTLNEVNNIFQEAGLIELDKFKNNTINEASEESLIKTIKDKIVAALVKAWEGLKAAWGKLSDTINKKIDEINKRIGEEFKKIDFYKYGDSIKKSLDKNDLTVINIDKTNDFIKQFTKAKDKAEAEIDTSFNFDKFDNVYQLLIDKYFSVPGISGAGIVKIDGIEDAKKFITDSMRKEKYKEAGSSVDRYKDYISGILTKTSRGAINKGYSESKKSLDKATRELKKMKDEEGINKKAKCLLQLELAYQTLMVDTVGKSVKEALASAVKIATKCIVACKKQDKAAKNESATFDTNFVNKAFDW